MYWIAIVSLSIISIGLGLALMHYRRKSMAMRAEHDHPNATLVKLHARDEKEIEQRFARHSEQLEDLAAKRTADLIAANNLLQQAAAERSQIEHALHESEENFRLLTENSQDTIFRYDLLPEHHLAYVSPAVVHLTGFTPKEHYANPRLAVQQIDEQDRLRLAKIMDAPAAFHEPIEVRWKRKDGAYVWSELRHVPIFDEAGNCVTVMGIARDITPRRLADEQLRKLSSAVEQCSVAITITDRQGRIEYVNPRFTEISGFSLDEVSGRMPRILWPENEDLPQARQLKDALRNDTFWRGEIQNSARDGRPYWESGIISPIQDRQGNTTHYLAVMEDATQRKQQERVRDAVLAVSLALRSANSREEMLSVVLREIATTFDAVRASYIIPDPITDGMNIHSAYEDGRFITPTGISIPPGQGVAARVHQTGEAYVTSDALNDPIFAAPDMLNDARAVACVPLIAQEHRIGLFSIARVAPFSIDEVRLLAALADMAANGLQRAAYYEETLSYAANLEREVNEQTRELREAYDRLKELDHLKSKFVSDVSHELRTPVTNIGLYLKLFERKPEKQAHYLSILREEAERLEKLVLDILDLARLDIDAVFGRAPTDLNKVAAAVVEAHTGNAESRKVQLNLLPSVALPWVMGEAEKLGQIVNNLLSNAINYTPAGFVTVRTQTQGPESVQLIIEDSGTGIYPEDLPHVFERFYRGKRDQVTNAPGTGLGLSIVKELVELHEGTIRIDSEVGKGTQITVTFPTWQADN